MSFLAIVVTAIVFIIYAFGGKKKQQNGENFPFPIDMDIEEPTIAKERPIEIPKSTPPEVPQDKKISITTTSSEEKKIDFDLKKAIIYSTILEPKFKEFE